MIAFILITLFSLSSNEAFAFKIESRWNSEYKKEVVLKCDEVESESLECYQICGNMKECVVYEPPCKNCIGTSVFMTHLFENIGKSYVNSNQEVSLYEFFLYLNMGNFATISSKSIYNHVTRYDTPDLKNRFKSLCSDISGEEGTEYPNVFLGVESVSRTPMNVLYVSCVDRFNDTRIFRMETYGGVEITPYEDELR